MSYSVFKSNMLKIQNGDEKAQVYCDVNNKKLPVYVKENG